MSISLSDHFSYKTLLKFTIPSMIMMMFTSIYSVVDGFFVSNFVGKTPFAAINLIMPFLMIIGAVGFMLGTGGSALVAKTFGEGDKEKANKLFSMFVYLTIGCGIVLSALGIIFLPQIAHLLGAEGEMLTNCVIYGRIILIALPAFMLQHEFQSFLITAEKPQLGLVVTVASGVTNIILDTLFIAIFKWGIAGAALATMLAQLVGGIVPLTYFIMPNKSLLRLGKTTFNGKALVKACTNGSSELMSNISMSVVSVLYNTQLLKYAGENGVAAYGVIMYVGFIFISAFIGYAIGTAPVIGYHFGAKNIDELKGILKKSFVLIGIFGITMFTLSELLAYPLAKIFVGYDAELLDLTVHAFRIFSFIFLGAGFVIFISSFFTALNDGLTSAIVSFLRSLVFQVAAILILPIFFGIEGVWLSTAVSEITSVSIAFLFLFINRKKYNYM